MDDRFKEIGRNCCSNAVNGSLVNRYQYSSAGDEMFDHDFFLLPYFLINNVESLVPQTYAQFRGSETRAFQCAV